MVHLKVPGRLYFSEFLEAAVSSKRVNQRELLYAFRYFDTDSNGYITEKDLSEIKRKCQ